MIGKSTSFFIIHILQGSSVEAKTWRYWPNIGCFDFNFERTVFFELSNDATELSITKGLELRKLQRANLTRNYGWNSRLIFFQLL